MRAEIDAVSHKLWNVDNAGVAQTLSDAGADKGEAGLKKP